jgi:cyclopropane fatty-acyl-phospholipid synthase-like methyltransferase
MTEVPYVHGYSVREADRLADQANTLSELLHHDTVYPPGSLVLECGCGTGAQTVILAARNPGARIVAVDISAASLGMVDRRTWEKGIADLYRATEPGGTFCYTFFKGTGSR